MKTLESNQWVKLAQEEMINVRGGEPNIVLSLLDQPIFTVWLGPNAPKAEVSLFDLLKVEIG